MSKLTDEQIEDLYFDEFSISKLKEFARAIEAAATEPLLQRIAKLAKERDEWKYNALNGANAQYLRKKNAELKRQLHEQAVSLEQARKDAERYRWLRDLDEDPVLSLAAQYTDMNGSATSISQRIDVAIDAAMQKGQP